MKLFIDIGGTHLRSEIHALKDIPYREAPFFCRSGKNSCIEFFASGASLEQWMRYNKEEGYNKKPNLEKLKK